MTEPWRGIGIIHRGPPDEPIFGEWEYSTGTGASPSGTLTWPQAPVSGDIAICFLCKSNTTSGPNFHADFGAPAFEGQATSIYTRECDGTEELGGYTVVVGGAAQWVGIILLLTGFSGVTPVGNAFHNEGGTGDIVYPTITPSDTPSLIFMEAHGINDSGPAPITPGGTNPTLSLFKDSLDPPMGISNSQRAFIFIGDCTGTSAIGDRTVACDGIDPIANNYSSTFGIKDF